MKQKSPPGAKAGGARECIAVAANAPEIQQLAQEIQNFRVAWLARKFALTPAMAHAIAGIVFSTKEAAR